MNLLIVTEDKNYIETLKNSFKEKVKFFHASNLRKFEETIPKIDAAIIDYSISWANGIQLLKEVKKRKQTGFMVIEHKEMTEKTLI